MTYNVLFVDLATPGAAEVREVDAVQKAVAELRVKFLGLQDQMLLFRLVDGFENYPAEEIDVLMQSIVEALDNSHDSDVEGLLNRATRVGVL